MKLQVIREAAARHVRTPVNLSHLSGWRDLLMLVGVAAIVRGVYIWNHGAAWIVAGAFLLAGSILMAGDERP